MTRKRKTFKIVFNIVLWIVLLCWLCICIIDFHNTNKEKDPMFCLNKKTITYDDGNVYVCTGLGYKIYNYQRKSFTAIQYGPLWSKDRSNEESK